MRAVAWLGFGHGMLEELDADSRSYKPGVVFGRPSSLPTDNGVLVWHLRDSCKARGRALSKEIAEDFFGWRDAFVKAEMEDWRRVESLLTILTQCADAPERAGLEVARKLAAFVEEHWRGGVALPRPLPRRGDREWSRLIRSIVRREAECPSWLLDGCWLPNEDNPPRDVRVRPPADIAAEQAAAAEAAGELPAPKRGKRRKRGDDDGTGDIDFGGAMPDG